MVTVRLFKRGKYYHLDIRDGNHRWKESLRVSNKLDAQALRSKRETTLNEGTSSFIPKTVKINFYDASKKFIEAKKEFLKEKTIRRYICHFNQIIPTLGLHTVYSITKKDIEDFRDSRTASKSTINRDIEVLRNFFNWAIENNYASDNPAKQVKRFKEISKSPEAISKEECRKLLDACDEEFIRTFIMIGLHTGCRSNEILSLRWEDVRFDEGTFLLYNTKASKDEKIVMNGTLKNYIVSIKRDQGYVVSKSDGSKYGDIRKAWERVVNKAGIRRITPHVLRHTFATLLLNNGVSPRTVMALGRWSDLSLLRRYTHSTDSDQRNGVEIIGGMLEEKGTNKEQYND